MPELPEVETIKVGLLPLQGQQLKQIEIFVPKMALPDAATLVSELKGETLYQINRRGKYLLLYFSNQQTLIIHLKMTGQLLLYPQPQPPLKYTRAVLTFSQYQLHFNDVRKFGFLKLVNSNSKLNLPLGPEPLEKSFTQEILVELIQQRRFSKKPVKAHLLDQTFIAGLGNIYADEILFAAQINPLRLLNSLNSEDITRLYQALKKVLTKAIVAGGTTFSNYLNAQGKTGNYSKQLQVYQRANQKCFNCNHFIVKIKIAGRSSYFCPHCQK